MKVKWYHSLRFKLFVLMSAYLFVTVAAISWQNGTVFKEIMDRQNQDSLVGVAQKGAVSVNGMLNLWSSLANSLTQNVSETDKDAFDKAVKSFLAGNPEAVAFQLVAVSDAQDMSPMVFRFTEDTTSKRFEGKMPRSIATKLDQLGFSAVEKRRKKPEKFIENLFKDTKLPLLQLGFPYQVKAQRQTYWAVVTIWQESIAAHLERRGEDFRTYVAYAKGGVFLAHPKDLMTMKVVDPNVREAIVSKQKFKSYKGPNQEPMMASFETLTGTDLVFVVEKNAAADYRILEGRIRKIALMGWIIMLFTVMGSYLLSGRVTKSIDAVAKTTLQIAQGNLEARNRPRSRDEVGLLAASVNHMAEQIHRLLVVEVEMARQEKELRTAQAVQSTLFPKRSTQDSALAVTGHYEPASECAGDWWGCFKLTEQHSLIVVADATGHGAPAALLVALAYAYFQTLIVTVDGAHHAVPSPTDMLIKLNRLFWESGQGASTMTMFIGLVDLAEGKLRYVNAGHVNPLAIPLSADDARLTAKRSGGSGKAKRILPIIAHGSPLGYKADPEYSEFTMDIAAGDKFFFYTDGLVECTNYANVQWGGPTLKNRLTAHCELTADGLKETIVDEARAHFGEHPRADDVTVVVAQVSRDWVLGTRPVDAPAPAPGMEDTTEIALDSFQLAGTAS